MIFQHGIVNDYSIFKNPVFINDYCQRLINIDFSWGNKRWFLGHTSYWIHMDQSMFIPWYKRLQSMCNKGFFQQKMLLGQSSTYIKQTIEIKWSNITVIECKIHINVYSV